MGMQSGPARMQDCRCLGEAGAPTPPTCPRATIPGRSAWGSCCVAKVTSSSLSGHLSRSARLEPKQILVTTGQCRACTYLESLGTPEPRSEGPGGVKHKEKAIFKPKPTASPF